jgi:hypothetical protein
MVKTAIITLILVYQRFISPLLAPSCRVYPYCSNYAFQAVCKYGAVRGGLMTLGRLIRCHPFHPGGFDPVD